MAYEGGDYERVLKIAALICVGIGIAAFLAFRPGRVPDPKNSAAFGCYAAKAAPTISLGSEGMSIGQPRFPRIGFHLERHKTGIALTAEAPIFARPADGFYVYGISKRGIGWFMPFLKIVNGSRYGAFDESDLSRFTMLAEDGTYLTYERVAPGLCTDGVAWLRPLTPPASAQTP